MGLTSNTLKEGLGRVVDKMALFSDELNSLDGKIGDGDLGVTLTRCAKGVREVLPSLPEDLGMALMSVVQAVTKVSGASFATLLAGGLMAAAKAVRGRFDLSWEEVPDLFRIAQEAMMARGKAALGEKTVIDALEAARSSTVGLRDPGTILESALKGVSETIDRMRNQPIQSGRARIWAEKSIGLDDPGMIAFKRILESLVQ